MKKKDQIKAVQYNMESISLNFEEYIPEEKKKEQKEQKTFSVVIIRSECCKKEETKKHWENILKEVNELLPKVQIINQEIKGNEKNN